MTGLARADVLLWCERLRSRTTPDLMDRVDEAQQRRFGILIPADREWPTGLDELGDRAPYLFVDAGRFFISDGRAGWETPPRHRCTCRRDVLRAALYGLASTGTWSPRAKRDQPQWRQSGSRASPCSIVSSMSG